MRETSVYRVESVEVCDAPRRAEQGGWCRYVLLSGSSRIVGRHLGNLSQTRREAHALADKLNSRLRSGKVPWTARSRKRK
jgi:hypothetical protein